MSVGPITVGELPSPEEDPIMWAVVFIAGLPCPGQYLCDQSEGARERDTQHRKSKGSSRDILIDQGLTPTVQKIRIRTTNPQDFRSLYDFYLKYMDPDRPLTRLNLVEVSHPQLYSRGIKQGYFKRATLPKPSKGGGIYPFISEFDFNVTNPKTQIQGSGGATVPKSTVGPQKTPFRWTQVGTIIEAQQLGSLFFGQQNQGLSKDDAFNQQTTDRAAGVRPPDQPVTLYTPAGIQKVANAGDGSARFVSDNLSRFAPR